MNTRLTKEQESIFASLDPEQVEEFRKFDEHMKSGLYSDILNSQKYNEDNYAFYLLSALRSGLEWKELSENEIFILQQYIPQECWQKYEKN